MTKENELSRYRFIPGQSVVLDDSFKLDDAGLHDLDGNPITEESCLRESLEDERRVRAGLIPGGKSLSGDGTHSPALKVVVSNDLRKKVAAAAAAENMSVSRWARRVLEKAVA